MSKSEPTIQKFMTYQPHFIEADQPISEAWKMMNDLKIRHLPVLGKGRVFGLLSDRDIKMAMGLIGPNPEKILVRDICHENPYQVEPETLLHEVADEMAKHHYGSALVVQNEKLVGIFTTVDVCKALSQILQQRFHSH